jgi:hypothetical protein
MPENLTPSALQADANCDVNKQSHQSTTALPHHDGKQTIDLDYRFTASLSRRVAASLPCGGRALLSNSIVAFCDVTQLKLPIRGSHSYRQCYQLDKTSRSLDSIDSQSITGPKLYILF